MAGIHRQILTRLVSEGTIEAIARGVYRLAQKPITQNNRLAVVATKVPHAVVCLLSALQYDEIGSQLPSEVWIALERRAWRPTLSHPPLRIVRYLGQALTQRVEIHNIEGVDVKVCGVAKTLADCFKCRNKIGIDVALEALREAWRERHFTMGELDRYSTICRVRRVMQPFLETLAA